MFDPTADLAIRSMAEWTGDGPVAYTPVRSYLVELSNPTKSYSLMAVLEALRMSISTR